MIDTRNKRAGAMLPTLPWRGLWPAPDGTLDVDDRRQIALLYPFGVAAPAVPVEAGQSNAALGRSVGVSSIQPASGGRAKLGRKPGKVIIGHE